MNTPNKISMVRIALIPIFVVLFLLNGYIPYSEIYGAAVFALACFTDFLDGYIARKYNMVTTLGKYLDSIADKLLVASALILLPVYILPLADFPVIGLITIASVAIIIAREFVISALRQAAAAANYVLAADNFGRIKAAVQDVALIVLLPAPALERLFGLSNHAIVLAGFGLLCVATILTILSAINYLKKHASVLSENSLTENKNKKG